VKSHFHCVYKINYHLVLVTKYRRKCLTGEIRDRAKEISTSLLSKWDCELIEFNGESDHLHLLIEANPTVQPSKLVNSLKTVSSRYLRKEFEEHFKKFYWKPALWTRAYCLLSTGGGTIDIIRKYIEKQGKH